jgi:hypothetical protein
VTSHFEDLHGLKPEDVAETVDALMAGVHPDDREGFERSIADSAWDLSPGMPNTGISTRPRGSFGSRGVHARAPRRMAASCGTASRAT